MDANKLYRKHLKKITPKSYVSPKQMDGIKYEATINAINEALGMKWEN
tara:strand:+ start:153911 stop:154054 length:144 start_codon:yes stop_codon:yes gene_type:complete